MKKKILAATLSLSMMLTASISPCYALEEKISNSTNWRKDELQKELGLRYLWSEPIKPSAFSEMTYYKDIILIHMPFVTWYIVCRVIGCFVQSKCPCTKADDALKQENII